MDNLNYKNEVITAYEMTRTGEKKFLKRYMFLPEYIEDTFRILADYYVYDILGSTPQEVFESVGADYFEIYLPNIIDKVPVKTEYSDNKSKNFIYYVYKDILVVNEKQDKIRFYNNILSQENGRFPKKTFLSETGKEDFKLFFEFFFLEKHNFEIDKIQFFANRTNISVAKLASIFPSVWKNPEAMIKDLYPEFAEPPKKISKTEKQKYACTPEFFSASGKKTKEVTSQKKNPKKKTKKIEEVDWVSLSDPNNYKAFLDKLDSKEEKRGRKRKTDKIPTYLQKKSKRGRKPRKNSLAGKELLCKNTRIPSEV